MKIMNFWAKKSSKLNGWISWNFSKIFANFREVKNWHFWDLYEWLFWAFIILNWFLNDYKLKLVHFRLSSLFLYILLDYISYTKINLSINDVINVPLIIDDVITTSSLGRPCTRWIYKKVLNRSMCSFHQFRSILTVWTVRTVRRTLLPFSLVE